MRSFTRITRRYGLVVGLILAVAASASAQATAPSPGAAPSNVIVAGQAIGPWTLDMTFAEFIWNLGPRNTQLTGPGPQFRTDTGIEMSAWTSPPLVAFHGTADNMVYALGIADPGYATPQRIGVGVSEARVVAAYGAPSAVIQLLHRPKFLIFDGQGLAFQIALNPVTGAYGPVERVYIFRPGRAGGVWRTP